MGANTDFKSARMAKLWELWQGHPKVPFSEKVQRGDQGKFFKNRLKSRLKTLKILKSTLAEITLSSNLYALNVERLDKIFAYKAAPKMPEWPSYGNFRQVTQTRIF